MPKLHLRKSGFIDSVCGSFSKPCERIQIFRKTGNLKHIYKNELHKVCFAHDAANPDIEDLAKRIVSDKILKDRAYEITMNPKYDWCQRG